MKRWKKVFALGYAVLCSMSIPANSIQRFAMAEDAFYITIDKIRMPTTIRQLTWRGVEYYPLPNRRASGWLEWNVAPDGTPGPAPIYGEKISVLASTDHDNMHYQFCCIPWSQVESGHSRQMEFPAQLLLKGNPEAVLLYWGANGLYTKAKEN